MASRRRFIISKLPVTARVRPGARLAASTGTSARVEEGQTLRQDLKFVPRSSVNIEGPFRLGVILRHRLGLTNGRVPSGAVVAVRWAATMIRYAVIKPGAFYCGRCRPRRSTANDGRLRCGGVPGSNLFPEMPVAGLILSGGNLRMFPNELARLAIGIIS
jgi:hypothetical protein